MVPSRRLRLPLLAGLLVGTALVGRAPAQDGERPAPEAGKEPPAAEAGLSLEIVPDEAEVALGERITLQVTLRNGGARAAAVNPLRLGSPDSLSFRVKEKGRIHQVARLYGTWEQNGFKADAVARKELQGGSRMDERIDLLALLPGELEITASYRGVKPGEGAGILTSRPVTVTVRPGPAGETRIGARIRTGKGTFTATLHPEKAWNTVHNFLTLAAKGFYNGRYFHRIVEDFMVQTGDPKADGTGGPGYSIPAEPNNIPHEKGTLSMARSTDPNSAGSQFFVMHGKKAFLDWNYTGFGRVVEGLDVVDTLATLPVRWTGTGRNREKSEPVARPRLEGVEMVLLPGGK